MSTVTTTTATRALALCLLLAACGDDTSAGAGGGGSATSTSGDPTTTSTTASTGGQGGDVGSSTGGGDVGGGGAGGDGSGGEGAGGAPVAIDLGELVINEVSLDGLDWIELYNAGDAPVDLEGVRIADQDKDAPGTPKLSAAVTFTGDAATVLPGEFLFVLADQDPAGEGPQEACDPGPAPCFHTGWGLSTGDGDVVFLLGPDDGVLQEVAIAPNAAVLPATWSRFPDGTGDFAPGAATPGAPNEALLPPK